MERKDFIKQCGVICMGGLAAAALLESCAGNHFASSKIDSNRLLVKKTEFIEVANGISKPRPYVLVRTEKLAFPVCIYLLNENTYSALLMECTHKSCELNPQGNYLSCPCHGSEFNRLGEVQSPPAEMNLKNFKTTHDHENVYVYLS